jgi:putative methyltransferase (TIGR04325 family)
MQRLANWPVTAAILNAMLGYLRVFDNLQEAEAAVRPYAAGGFYHPGYANLHLKISEVPRPSDYAVMFHLRGLDFRGAKVFDVGGNVGNLLYLYDRYLHLPENCIWQVFELPPTVELGQKSAASHGESRLCFTDKWEDAEGAELLIASGSLHYFDPPLSEMVARLAEKPTYILINRTPLIAGPTKAAVQDHAMWRVACILYNKTEVIRSFEAIGYELVDSWEARERSLKFVGRPECSADFYSGFFFRLKHMPLGLGAGDSLVRGQARRG